MRGNVSGIRTRTNRWTLLSGLRLPLTRARNTSAWDSSREIRNDVISRDGNQAQSTADSGVLFCLEEWASDDLDSVAHDCPKAG